jgi:hypothetical protein
MQPTSGAGGTLSIKTEPLQKGLKSTKGWQAETSGLSLNLSSQTSPRLACVALDWLQSLGFKAAS